MPNRTNRILLLAAGAMLASCGSVPTRTFQIRAINVNQEPVPCVVVINDDWTGAAERNQFLTPSSPTLKLPVQFQVPAVTLTAAALQFDADGKPLNVPSSRSQAIDFSDYLTEVREDVRATDPDVVLFVLRKK
ncbi:MAG TPA: hypothetical protein VFZ65_01150 [Planctomycetota bacterium]|nr:hypothetical protein [Planctomycetota bacterium]